MFFFFGGGGFVFFFFLVHVFFFWFMSCSYRIHLSCLDKCLFLQTVFLASNPSFMPAL